MTAVADVLGHWLIKDCVDLVRQYRLQENRWLYEQTPYHQRFTCLDCAQTMFAEDGLVLSINRNAEPLYGSSSYCLLLGSWQCTYNPSLRIEHHWEQQHASVMKTRVMRPE